MNRKLSNTHDIMIEIVAPTTKHHSSSQSQRIGSKSEVRHVSSSSSNDISPSKVISNVLNGDVFENHLKESWSSRSQFRPPKSKSWSVSSDIPKMSMNGIPDLKVDILKNMMSKRAAFPSRHEIKEESSSSSSSEDNIESRGSKSSIKPLLAILHSSVIHWPQRNDVLVTAILTLESAEVNYTFIFYHIHC